MNIEVDVILCTLYGENMPVLGCVRLVLECAVCSNNT